jgi:hypothetical protein
MADAIITDVVQEVSRILTASDVVVDELKIDIRPNDPIREDGTMDYISLEMTYHQCKADCREGRLEEPQVDEDVKRKWSLSGGDDLKELVSIVLQSTNVKDVTVLNDHPPYTHVALSDRGPDNHLVVLSDRPETDDVLSYPDTHVVLSDRRPDTHDVIEQFLQGLCTNHTIDHFNLISSKNTTIDVLDKSADMLCHNIGLKHFTLQLLDIKGTTKHSGFGNALKMNHTLQSLAFNFWNSSIKLDFEELVRPLIIDENGHQANSTLTALHVLGLFAMSSVGATFARMLQKNSSIKHLNLDWSLTSESDVQELIRSLVENHSLETLDLLGCHGVQGSVFPTIMDVLLVNFTLKDIKLYETPLHAKGKHLAIEEQL